MKVIDYIHTLYRDKMFNAFSIIDLVYNCSVCGRGAGTYGSIEYYFKLQDEETKELKEYIVRVCQGSQDCRNAAGGIVRAKKARCMVCNKESIDMCNNTYLWVNIRDGNGDFNGYMTCSPECKSTFSQTMSHKYDIAYDCKTQCLACQDKAPIEECKGCHLSFCKPCMGNALCHNSCCRSAIRSKETSSKEYAKVSTQPITSTKPKRKRRHRGKKPKQK